MANESAFDNAVTTGRLGVITLTTAYGTLAAGTTATEDVQNCGVGTNGQALTSNGAAAIPTWENQTGAGAASQADQETGTATNVYVSPGRQQYHQSSAKVWINFDGTAEIGERSSYNVASITDDDTGTYTVTIATDFSDANYAVTACGRRSSSADFVEVCILDETVVAGEVQLECLNNDGATAIDCDYVCIACYGDQ